MKSKHTSATRLTAIAGAMALCFSVMPSIAAERVELTLEQLSANTKGQVGMAKVQSEGGYNSLQSLKHSSDSFAMAAERPSVRGEVLERGQQKYKNIPVWGAEFVATRNSEGKYTFLTGTMLRDVDRDISNTTPKLSAAQASQIAKQAKRMANIGALVQTENRRESLRGRKVSSRSALNVEFEKPTTLTVYQDDTGRARLVWVVEFGIKAKSGQLPQQPVMFIDAHTGELVWSYDNVHTAEENGKGPGGNARMGRLEHGTTANGVDGATRVTKNGTTCTLQNSVTAVYDAAGSTSTPSSPKSFNCGSDNRFVEAEVNGGYGVLNDILYNGTKTAEMYQNWFGVFPLKCASVIRQTGHYDRNLDNAYWQNCRMTYGDGNTFHPLVSMDVVGHEIAHGVTEGRSNLAYANQSGGLNESFSDIAGSALVYYITGSNTWKIGDQIKKNSGQMRCMDEPTCDGRSIKHVNNYTNGMDVHFSSGVYNHAFYRLATSSGWNTKKAFEIYYRANDRYWTSSSTFAQAGEGVCKAAVDLGYDTAAVKASLQAVGVNPTSCTGGTTPTPDTTLSNGVAVTGQSFTQGESKFYLLDVPSGATNLSFTTTGGSGDVDLYVKFGSKPSTTTNDCKSEGSNNNETCNISSVQTGKYYVLVSGYAASSGVSVKGQYTPGGGTPPGDGVVTLTNGQAISNVSFTANQSRMYKLDVPSGATNLKFVTSGGSGDVDLYVKFGSQPTTTSNDCKSEGQNTNETCNISSAQSGTYYVLVYGYAASNGVSITGSYSTGGGTPTCQNLPQWNANTYYYAGTEVQYNGRKYRALANLWYYPPTTAQYWQDLGACS